MNLTDIIDMSIKSEMTTLMTTGESVTMVGSSLLTLWLRLNVLVY